VAKTVTTGVKPLIRALSLSIPSVALWEQIRRGQALRSNRWSRAVTATSEPRSMKLSAFRSAGSHRNWRKRTCRVCGLEW